MNMRYFRVGAGTVLYQPTGQIVIFERSDLPGVWQLEQGGADSLEDSLTTAWRELKEETGLTETDILTVEEYPDWLAYAYPPALQVNLKNRDCLGQIHRWYFMALKPNATIDLTLATDKEFCAWRFSTFDELLTLQVPPNDIKKGIYEQLAHYFNTTILHTPSE